MSGDDNLTGPDYPLSACTKMIKRYNHGRKYGAVDSEWHRINRGKIMNPNIGVLLVIGFPLALLAVLWIFGKVSVRPE